MYGRCDHCSKREQEPGIGRLRRTIPGRPCHRNGTTHSRVPAGKKTTSRAPKWRLSPRYCAAQKVQSGNSTDWRPPKSGDQEGDGRPGYPKRSRRPSEMATDGCVVKWTLWRRSVRLEPFLALTEAWSAAKDRRSLQIDHEESFLTLLHSCRSRSSRVLQNGALAVCSQALGLYRPQRPARQTSELCEAAATDMRQIRFYGGPYALAGCGRRCAALFGTSTRLTGWLYTHTQRRHGSSWRQGSHLPYTPRACSVKQSPASLQAGT